MSNAAEPIGETLCDEDLKSDKQIVRRSIRTAAVAATGAALAAGAASMLGATAPPAQAADHPGGIAAPTLIASDGVDLTDADLTSRSEAGPVTPTDLTNMKGDTCPIGGDEWKGVYADGECKKVDKYPWQ